MVVVVVARERREKPWRWKCDSVFLLGFRENDGEKSLR